MSSPKQYPEHQGFFCIAQVSFSLETREGVVFSKFYQEAQVEVYQKPGKTTVFDFGEDVSAILQLTHKHVYINGWTSGSR